MMRAAIMVVFACLWGHGQAQWGLHFGGGVQHSAFDPGTRSLANFALREVMVGIGYWHDTSPRTAWCLGLALPTDLGNGNEQYSVLVVDAAGTSSNRYSVSPWFTELRFRSCYFLADNTEAAGYLGLSTGLALHRVSFTQQSGTGEGPAASRMPVSMGSLRPVVPLCLHLGLRGDLRYVYIDWHVWTGYQFGARSLLPDGYTARRWETGSALLLEPPAITWGMGFALGFGSDGKKVK